MTTTLNASTAGAGGFIATSDNSGILALQTAGTTALSIDSSQNVAFNSGYGSVATAYACRAWVNFNGTGTVAIRASANVSSITDNSTGNYTINFTTAMPDANYAVSMSLLPTSSSFERPELVTLLAASVRVIDDDGSNNPADPSIFTVAVFR